MVLFEKGRGLLFTVAARLYPPADRTPLFTGSVPSDDSQFFATPEVDPNLPESICPANRQMIGGAPLF